MARGADKQAKREELARRELPSERCLALILSEDYPVDQAVGVCRRLLDDELPEAGDALEEAMRSARAAILEEFLPVLRDAPGPVALRALGSALSNPDAFARMQAARALAHRPNPAVLALLLRASRDPSSAIARVATASLVRVVTSQADILNQVRIETAEGVIDHLDAQWAMELLSDAFPDPIRAVAARRLGAIGGEEATSVLAGVVEVAPEEVAEACWQALEASGAVSDHLLLPLLFNSKVEVKRRALAVYARWADAVGGDMLAGFTSDADAKTRAIALQARVRLTGTAALDDVRRLARDEDPEVRGVAIAALAQMEGTEPDLADLVSETKDTERQLVLTALANRGVMSPELGFAYLEYVMRGASETDASRRSYLDGVGAAARTLSEHQLPEALIGLAGLARSVIKRLRRIAIEGIMRYPPEERVDALASLEDTYDNDVLRNVALGLLEAGDHRAVVPLVRAALECRGRAARAAKVKLDEIPERDDVPWLVAALRSRWAAVRRWSAERLRELRDPSSVEGLLAASRDEDVEVQLAVFEALGPFASSNEDVTQRMVDAVGYGDITVRQAACEALGEARCQAAVPNLVAALANCFLRPRAAEALKRIGDRKGVLALKRIERREKLFPKKPKEALAKKGKSVV